MGPTEKDIHECEMINLVIVLQRKRFGLVIEVCIYQSDKKSYKRVSIRDAPMAIAMTVLLCGKLSHMCLKELVIPQHI